MSKPRGIIIAGNWKMNHGLKETETYFSEIKNQFETLLGPSSISLFRKDALTACVAPPALSLQLAQSLAAHLPFPISIAAQNASGEKKGAFTGEISGPMLHEIGVSWVIIGHSERRQFFGETNQSVKQRTESLLEQGFKVILCIGETRAEREAGKTQDVLTQQLTEAIPDPQRGISQFLDGRTVIAYEPVWAIGTGLTATPDQAEEAHQIIRDLLKSRFGIAAANQTPVIYGGSVTPANAASLLGCPNVDGALVGGASLKAESFLEILREGVQTLN